jgi:hypothetical protein
MVARPERARSQRNMGLPNVPPAVDRTHGKRVVRECKLGRWCWVI